ncbi:unnamed protein product [Rotaria sp. Silwood2]|nr:unnamed protein product [Rotaria sp. Silwood2]
MRMSNNTIFFILLAYIFNVVDESSTVLSNVKLVIETAKSAKNIWEFVKDFPPTFADYLVSIVSKSDDNQNEEKDTLSNIHSSYDFVVDLTRPTDIFRGLKAYPVAFPLGKDFYDNKIKEDGNQISRFVVNVVGRYNVGKTYILRLLANINLGHSFVERTNGLSVSLPFLSQTQDTPIALIDTAGTRTPVEYQENTFSEKSYERQVSDSFIQEIALNSAEIFVHVVNQLTLDDQLYLKTLYKRLKDKGFSEIDIKQKLLIVHNYFNLRTSVEVEETEKFELIRLFGARKQPQGYWISEHFKHFVIASTDSEAGQIYNNRSIEQIRTMIKGSNAAKNNDILDTIMKQIELLLSKVLVEELPSTSERDDEVFNHSNIFAKAYEFATSLFASNHENRLHASNKRNIKVQLELKEFQINSLETLWFICPKQTFANNIKFTKHLKFAEDGSIHIDYSSQFVPDVHIFRLQESGNIQIRIECPSCANSYNVTARGSSILIQGEKMFENIAIDKDYLNTNRIGKFEIEIPLGKWEPNSAYDYRKSAIQHIYENGVIVITITNISNEL